MAFNYFTLHGTSPELDKHIYRAREERAFVIYAAFKAIKQAASVGIRGLAGTIRRAHRAHRTARALNVLSDRQLRDIGIGRADIPGVTAAAFMPGSGFGITLEDLYRLGFLEPAGERRPPVSETRPIPPLPPDDARARRPGNPTGLSAAHHRTACPGQATAC